MGRSALRFRDHILRALAGREQSRQLDEDQYLTVEVEVFLLHSLRILNFGPDIVDEIEQETFWLSGAGETNLCFVSGFLV